MPETRRLFVAWPVDDAIRAALGGILAPLRARLPAASWPSAASVHLTFAFLGDTPLARVGEIAAALDACAVAEAVDVAAAEAGVFPSESRPRVAWVGLGPREGVSALASAVREALAGADARFDPKPFRPHLTLARMKAPWRRSDVAAFREAFRGWSSPRARLDRIVLYESRLGSGGAVHTALHAVALRAG